MCFLGQFDRILQDGLECSVNVGSNAERLEDHFRMEWSEVGASDGSCFKLKVKGGKANTHADRAPLGVFSECTFVALYSDVRSSRGYKTFWSFFLGVVYHSHYARTAC